MSYVHSNYHSYDINGQGYTFQKLPVLEPEVPRSKRMDTTTLFFRAHSERYIREKLEAFRQHANEPDQKTSVRSILMMNNDLYSTGPSIDPNSNKKFNCNCRQIMSRPVPAHIIELLPGIIRPMFSTKPPNLELPTTTTNATFPDRPRPPLESPHQGSLGDISKSNLSSDGGSKKTKRTYRSRPPPGPSFQPSKKKRRGRSVSS